MPFCSRKTGSTPTKEARAVAALQERLRQLGAAGDEALLLDSIGETSLLEVIDRLLLTVAEGVGLAEGAYAVATALRPGRANGAPSRRGRSSKALVIAEIEKLAAYPVYSAGEPATIFHHS